MVTASLVIPHSVHPEGEDVGGQLINYLFFQNYHFLHHSFG
jgi:hypothetical protein